jgi:signal transduction histidine kinase
VNGTGAFSLQVRLCATVAGAFGLGTIVISRGFPGGVDTMATQRPTLPFELLCILLLGTVITAWPCARWLRARGRGPAGPAPRVTAAARDAALLLPQLVLRAGLPLVVAASLLQLWLDLRRGESGPAAARTAALGATVGVALSVPVFVLLRAILRPLLLSLGSPSVPARPRLELRARLLWALPALTLTAAGPPALVAAARMPAATAGTDVALLCAGLALLLGAAAWSGLSLARAIGDDVRRVTRRIAAHARGEHPTTIAAKGPRLAEMTRLVDAVNALLARNAETDAAHFVAVERLLEGGQEKVRFLAHMSHDLRAPLNSVLGFADVLLGGVDGPLSAEARQAVAEIRRHGERTLRLVNQVLDVARVEAGRLELLREPCPPAEILSQALREARAAAGHRDVEVIPTLEPGMPPVWVDGARLTTALAGLVGYLLEETETGAVTVRLRALRGDGPPGLEVTMTASGIALPAEEIGEGPDAFRRLPRKRDLGLGPLLAQGIVELHGGTIRFGPDPEGGAAFCVRIGG